MALANPHKPSTLISALDLKTRISNLRDLSEFTDDDISIIVDQVLDKLLMPIHTKARSKQGSFLLGRVRTMDVSIEEIHIICKKVTEVFRSQPLFIKLRNRVEYFDEDNTSAHQDRVITTYIGGDIHGNFKELLRLFDNLGGLSSIFYPGSRKRIVFLGDNVNSGVQSLEVVLLLFCLKIKYPKNIYLLRGSHECGSICRIYGFYDEVKRRYNLRIFKWFVDVFNTMPVQLLLVEEKILCTPSGLSPHAADLEELEVMLCENPQVVRLSRELVQEKFKEQKLKNDDDDNDDRTSSSSSSNHQASQKKEETNYEKFLREQLKKPVQFSSEKKENIFTRDHVMKEILARPFDVPDEGLITDLLWAMPADADQKGWQENRRGVSFAYSTDIVEKFLEDSTYSIDDGDEEMLRKYYPERISHQSFYKKEKERRIELIVRMAFVNPMNNFCNYYDEDADGKVITVHSATEYKGAELHDSGTLMKVTYCEKGFNDGNKTLSHKDDCSSTGSGGDDDEQRKKWKKNVKVDFEIVLPRKYKERVF